MTTAPTPTPTLRNGLQGSCTLVGAGPGDPELLTLRAVRAIESATVLLVDDLVSEAIVALAPRTARIVRVGKRGGCKSTPQMDGFLSGHAVRLQEAQGGPLTALPTLPPTTDAASTAAYTRAVLSGELPVPEPIARQVEHLLHLVQQIAR